MNALFSKLPQLSSKQYRLALLIMGHLFFGVLILWSIVLYKERMLHFDSAYYAFNILYEQDFYIAHGRTVSYASQLLPLLAIKMGWSLKTFLVLYSLSFMLLFYAIYNLIVYGFKNPAGGIFMAIAVSLMIRFKFYAAISEVYFSLALAALLIAWLTKDRDRFHRLTAWQNLLVGMGLVLLLTTGHPIIVLPVLSFFAFDMFYNHRWKDVYNWGLIAFTIAVFYRRFSNIQAATDSYESRRFNEAFVQLEAFWDLFELKIWEILKWYFETQYAFPSILCTLLILVLIVRKKIFSSLVLILSVLALVAMIMVTYSYVNGKIYAMIDGYVGLIGVVLAIPIFYVVLKSKQHLISVLLIAGLLIFNLHRIYGKRKFFQRRQALIETMVQENAKADQRKLVLRMQDFVWDKFWYPWSLPYETVLLTALDDPKDAASIHMIGWNDGEDKWSKVQKVLGGDGRKIDAFPKTYFDLDQNKPVLITQFPADYK